MTKTPSRIDVIFDVDSTSPNYRPTLDAVAHAVGAAHATVDVRVERTSSIDDAYLAELPDAIVLGPGSPYRSPSAAELVVATARDRGVPLVAT